VSDLVGLCRADPKWAGRKMALLGFSLGASVALSAGSQDLPVDAVVEWYGSLPDEFFYQLKGMPPLLILHGQHDDNIPVTNAQQIMQLCSMKSFTCESHIYPDQGHGFLPPAYEDAVKRTLDFYSRQLK
jgi:dienelactone hydrolase